ncbi:MAG: ABC transporter ATP-binding protein [Negativicutes bacterium]|nr:ABC transporter ATP-binding protein [Negativicutes bacterium]
MLSLDNVCKNYGRETVVDSVSLAVNPGETMVVVGPSGCGKTTLLKLINRLIPLTSGRIFINGRDTAAVDPVALRRTIGYVIQQIGLLPHLTVRDNIAFVLELTGVSKAGRDTRAEELIHTVGLPENYLAKRPQQLSGGQQQRVGVARALAADPEVILMDEPFGALDPITRQQLQEVILDLQRKIRKTIVFVTHDIQEAFKLGSRIAIMRGGRLVDAGTARELINSDEAFVQQFLGPRTVFEVLSTIPVLAALDPSVPVIGPLPGGRLRDSRWEHALVTDGAGQLLGIVEKSAVAPDGSAPRPEDIRPCAATLDAGASACSAIEKMLTSGHCWLPVVDDGKLAGAVTFESCSGLFRLKEG